MARTCRISVDAFDQIVGWIKARRAESTCVGAEECYGGFTRAKRELNPPYAAMTGKFQGLYAVSVTYNYRMSLMLQIAEQEVLLLDIGSHDEVYR